MLSDDDEKCWEPTSDDRIQLALVDLSRAYFNATCDPEHLVYVQLPNEHEKAGQGLCGKLLQTHVRYTKGGGWVAAGVQQHAH